MTKAEKLADEIHRTVWHNEDLNLSRRKPICVVVLPLIQSALESVREEAAKVAEPVDESLAAVIRKMEL